jgi:arabinofuranosyltransferase
VSAPARDPGGRVPPVELGALGLALAIAACAMFPVRGYLTDDTFIHLQYARHLASGAGPVFNLGERVYGCTSPLWIGLIALGLKLGANGLAVAKTLGGAATLASVALFFQLARRTLRSPWLRAFATVAWAANAWMIRWSLSGMETPLATALTLAGFVSLVSTEPWGGRRARTGALWALAALTRPEATALLVAWGLALLADPANRARPARLLAAVLAPLSIVGAWLLFARAYYGSTWPQTLSAKAAGSGGLPGLIDNLRRMGAIVGASDGVLVLLLIAALGVSLRRRPLVPPGAMALLPWAWALGVPALYLARGVPVLSRYLVVVLPVLEWLAWRAAERTAFAARDIAAPAPRLAWLVVALSLAGNAATYEVLVVPQVTSFTRGMEASLIPLGRWLGAHAPADAQVATPDIGAIGYFSQRRVIDLGGLVTPRMIPLLEAAPFEEVLARFAFADFARPAFVLDRAAAAGDLLRRSPWGSALGVVDTAESPNLGIARPGRVVYTLYQVDWNRMDTMRKPR